MVSDIPPHPATYSKEVLEVVQRLVPNGARVLDPFAGVGYHLVDALPNREVVGIELEPEWAAAHPNVRQGNALYLPFKDGDFKWAVTSPVYGSRMSDSHNAQEKCKNCDGIGYIQVPISDTMESDRDCPKCDGKGRREYKRITYTHKLGRKLSEDNAGSMQWGPKYREMHQKAWRELARVLNPDAREIFEPSYFILNISDHIRKGEQVKVTDWHVETLQGIGFEPLEFYPVTTPRMKFGANRDARVENEWVILFELIEIEDNE